MTHQEKKAKRDAACERVVLGENLIAVAVEQGYSPEYLAQMVRKYRARRGRVKPKSKGATT